MTATHLQQGAHVGDGAGEMDGNDRPRAVRNRCRCRRRVHTQALGVNVNENRDSVDVHGRTGGGDPGEAGHDHLVSRLHARGFERHAQRDGAVHHADPMRCRAEGREIRCELPLHRPVVAQVSAA